MNLTLPPKKPRSAAKTIRNIAVVIAVIAIYTWTFTSINIDWGRIFSERTIENMGRVIPQLFSPDWLTYSKVLSAMMETLAMAYTGTLMAAILAIPFGFFAASNMVKNKFFNTLSKWALDAIRAFPELMLAIIFIAAVGPSPFAGVLAIAIGSIGMLGKLYCEVIESIDMNVVEALEANGANKLQVLVYGIVPQILPEFLSYAIYRFEIDVRASTILGIVGAGGIGMLVSIATQNRNWDEVGMILLVIIIVVTLIDYISAAIRKRIV
ncbi:phosphonate ABC transporter, permease protein PhnE [Halalkalibacterium halodurans]|uniref:Alkylphosphonate ABC tranporter (Permease) n=1 Tax=Halalkalibacterium halodurans (strain ATCC BAA-125 / DSM 18197 / FERM 7344 / JCM 9153 / C-125) TaxID=272558 RepID=Q9K8M9_HALH5|nr:phosphonate ABC transporter, permease protein PhnE [Halalkalibacterium halodurans]MED4174164.1 phosphonate ABC transporter, permease protein PhnE [Halalkalibacterium halodurans]BAB06695.1 alkylphosphonate ABC tranporter (permease) [Halalkalibacterium halodurans C-125]